MGDMSEKIRQREKLEAIAKKARPSRLEMLHYIRHFLAEKGDGKQALSELGAKWGDEQVRKLIERIEKERKRDKPEKYHVSIREPLEDPYMK